LTDEFSVHRLTPDELGLVYTSWSKGYRATSAAKHTPDRIYITAQRAHMDRCIENGTTLVLTPPQDHDAALGWVCFEQRAGLPVVHWLYTKALCRGAGVARTLLGLAGWMGGELVVTQWNSTCDEAVKRGVKLVFDPYLVGR
jgi:hypothetical protein